VTDDPTERLGELFDAHFERLDRLARRLAPDRESARDLVQETFLRAARRPERVPGDEGGAEAWLVRVLVNLGRDRARRVDVRRRLTPEPARTAGPVAEEATAARELVALGLAALSPRQRAVLVLAELEGHPSAEIARLLGVAAVTVRWHLSAARREFARAVAEAEASTGGFAT